MKKITILQTSDIHGSIYPLNYGTNEAADVGLGKLATIIKQERALDEQLLLVDNGDLIQGTPLTYYYVQFLKDEKNPMISVLNHLSYDAAIIGNHEFNYGMDVVDRAVQESDFPWLSANIISESTGEPYFGKPYLIKTINSVKIAILGVTTHYIPNWESEQNIAGLKFKDSLQETKKWVAHIREKESPNVVIVSYHGGFERDLETGEPTEPQTGENQGFAICHEVEGIDVLLTGHQHRALTGNVNGVAIVQPSNNGQMLGKVTLTLNENNEIINKASELLQMEEVEANQEILKLTSNVEAQTQKWLDQPIGKIEGDMVITDAFSVRTCEHPAIEFINKVQMEAAGVDISSTSLFNNLSPGFRPNVTMRDIISNYMFPNTLKVLSVSGQDIKDALKQSASYFMLNESGELKVNPAFIHPKPQHYNYDMWEGIEYVLDIRNPIGERVTTLQYHGKPIDLDGKYQVVMNNYRAGGGGNYAMFKDKPIVKEIPLDMTEIITSYILNRQTVKATVNHNWKVVW
ncbi:bifunctional UDP-sugar hydrolase/5'-nucleotidase [Sporosarcina thermotolerans]|uniref:Bifunctional UDP-sugar hydrolase/5'-nucleotidase n=1 Tax=Sporosarcina thermotolerans TaxID=633404 RepID=A0AAW9ABY7_9BACL|nr:bifunctional UDP-sugar hydrolase/5'-nucleotidase [Sporosarcina thermotolerans]MDW0117724.1 bifunctional UDP-sugar hydrolase/5'-nucleotidase [Sporosarcina thermotolerans]WHT49185.1 bifunctional UDP-sugar hydrolase/5'-nucleotidase [Sporosarcina thermotolerans]